MATVILPGQKFNVSVGDKSYEVVALTGYEQEALGEAIDAAREAELSGTSVAALIKAAKQCLEAAVGPERAAAMWKTDVNARLAIDIATAVFLSADLDEDEAKN